MYNALSKCFINIKNKVQSKEESLPLSYSFIACKYNLTGFFINELLVLFCSFPLVMQRTSSGCPVLRGLSLSSENQNNETIKVMESVVLCSCLRDSHFISSSPSKQRKAPLLSSDFSLCMNIHIHKAGKRHLLL